jgi:hypothetical protein
MTRRVKQCPAHGVLRLGGMIINRALLPSHFSPAVSAAGARAAVLPFHLSLRSVSPQSFTAGARFHFLTAHDVGLCVDVSSRDAARGRKFTVDTDRRRAGFGHGGGRLQTPSLEFLSPARAILALSEADPPALLSY